ncbi:MAG: CPXCG motif-containing cysteine-rich protein [Acidobacteriota bacterium]
MVWQEWEDNLPAARAAPEEDPFDALLQDDVQEEDGLKEDGLKEDGLKEDGPADSLEVSSFGDAVTVTCPYCFEAVELLLEVEILGELVWDCEVCCNPWQLNVRRVGGQPQVEIDRLQ